MIAAITIGIGAVLAAWPVPIVVDDRGDVIVEAGGFVVHLAPELIAEPDLCARVLTTLRTDLATIESVVPSDAFSLLRARTPIWIEWQGAVVAGGMSGRGMVYHPSAFWLKANGLDPERAGGIEIVRAADYLAWRTQQPMMILHELAHAYHHLIGIDDPMISAAFERATGSGDYEAVRRVGTPGSERAYAMGNATEYFAELSEAYFGRNDFEPFDREELRRFDPAGFAVVERVWMLDPGAIRALEVGAAGPADGAE